MTDQKSKPSHADRDAEVRRRRALIKGCLASVPTVLTLSSTPVHAITSAVACLANANPSERPTLYINADARDTYARQAKSISLQTLIDAGYGGSYNSFGNFSADVQNAANKYIGKTANAGDIALISTVTFSVNALIYADKTSAGMKPTSGTLGANPYGNNGVVVSATCLASINGGAGIALG